MSFLEPVRLWCLLVIPLLLALYAVLLRRRHVYSVRFTNLALLNSVLPRRLNWRQHTAVGLALLTLAGGIVLFAKPAKEVQVPLSIDTQVTVIIVVDKSLSMGANDVAPDRITAAKSTAKTFVDQIPPDFMAGLVSFAGEATLDVAPTQDRQELNSGIDGLELAERTATGEGIYTALDVIKATSAAKNAALIMLISDGSRTAGRSEITAAEAAKAQGVPVYTVALGTSSGQISSVEGVVPVPVRTEQLERISSITGGQSFVAGTPEGLTDAYQSVKGEMTMTTEKRDATSDYLPWLLLLSLVSTSAGLFIASRWP